jgi:hypothetical protein
MPATLAALLCCLMVDTGIAPRTAAHLKIFSMYGDDPVGQQGIVNVRLNVAPYTSSAAVGLAFNWSEIDGGFKKYNMSAFVDIAGLVWNGRTGVDNPECPGWQANIAATVQAAGSRLASGAVAGLFLGATRPTPAFLPARSIGSPL